MNHYPISFDDMPQWVKDQTRAVLGQNKRPNAYVTALESPYIGGSFHDAQMLTLVAHNEQGRESTVRGTFGGINPFATNKENLINAGTKMHIPQSCAVLEISAGIVESVELFINPRDAVKFLPVSSDLSEVQCAVLDLLAGLTSAGRKYAIESYHIPQLFFDKVVSELQSAGMVSVNKAGAVSVTLKGKQVRNSWGMIQQYNSFWYKWGDSWDYAYNRQVPIGKTAQILAEYENK